MSALVKTSLIYGFLLGVVSSCSVHFVSAAVADEFFMYTPMDQDIDINVGLGWLESIAIGAAIGAVFGPGAGFLAQRSGWRFERASGHAAV